MSHPGPNELCPCGSGKKYKKCCRLLDEGRRTRSEVARSSRTLRDRNMALLGATADIFGLGRPLFRQRGKGGNSDKRCQCQYSSILSVDSSAFFGPRP